MDAELATLASSGATTLVGLMVTDSWNQARSRLAALFARGGDQRQIEAELEASREEVVSANEAGDSSGLTEAETEWRLRLRRLVQADPQAARELQSLIAELSPPPSQAGTNVVNNSLSGTIKHGSSVQGRDMGDVHIGDTRMPF